MVNAKVWRYVKAFEGEPNADNVQLQEETLPALGDGDVLFAAEFLSLDPYMRIITGDVGDPMVGEQVAKVQESNNPKFAAGSQYLINCGWRSHTVVNPDKTKYNIKPIHPGLHGLPVSLGLGTIGMPGATAYFALFKTLDIQPGKTILVNAASGAVGQVAGQIAKTKGLRVIGAAGSKEKCDFLKEIGYDIVIDYKTEDLDKALKAAAPDGIEYFIDMVGGRFTTTVIKNMAQRGRICSIGNISGYNKPETGELIFAPFFLKELRMEGLMIFSDLHTQQDWDDAFTQMTTWIKEGKLKYKEDITEGFENMYQGFQGLFTGANFGKAVVKV